MIGAGIAGLAAAQQLQSFGMDVTVVEARVMDGLLLNFSLFVSSKCTVWYGGGNSTFAEEVLQIPASLP